MPKPKHLKPRPQNAASPKPAGAPVLAPRPASFIPAAILMVLGAGASLMLSLDHLGALSLPGCGVGSGCAAAAKSEWARLGGVPIAFIGLAYFMGLFAAWVVSRGNRTRVISLCGHLAAAASLLYLGIAAAAKLWCIYCIAVHAVNLLLFPMLRSVRPSAPPSLRPIGLGFAVAALTLVAIIPLGMRAERDARDKAETQLADATAQIVERSQATLTPPTPPTPPTAPTLSESTDPAPPRAADPPPADVTAPLAGHYRHGPEEAPIRIVMFTDYQCPDCYKIEQELKALMATMPDLSVGIRYFPLSNKCNPAMGDSDLHPNACWAARAAEAAGILKGRDGFWQMHHWLFDRKGSFTDDELAAGLAQLGHDRKIFEQLMQSPQTAAVIKADVEAGQAMGIFYTPMIFINGVELKGWNAPNALTRAVQAVAATNPPAADNAGDIPPNARERYMNDWREQPVITIPAQLKRHTLSQPDAKVEVVLIGDYQEKNTADADGLLRVMFTKLPQPHIRYSFANFPVDKACNPHTQLSLHDQACLAARTAEAAEALGGPDLYWQMHDWLMGHQNAVHESGLSFACQDLNIDFAQLKDAAAQPFTAEAVAADADAAATLGITSVPLIYINGKRVPRWKLNNENLLASMVMEAAGQ